MAPLRRHIRGVVLHFHRVGAVVQFVAEAMVVRLVGGKKRAADRQIVVVVSVVAEVEGGNSA